MSFNLDRVTTTRLRRYALATTAIASIWSAQPLLAQDVQTAGPALENTQTAPSPGDQIVVLGTRRQDRSALDSAAPVDIIGATDLTTQPSANMLDTVSSLVPSFFVAQNTIADASSFVRSPSLRGLPGDETLVMLNGKRYNRSALVQVYSGGDTGLSYGAQGSDISAIPALAIKNLQILRDGATAQYGSDAIAGVLNFGLRDARDGFEVVGRYGQYYRNGDGNSYQIAGNVGLPLMDRGFINITAEYDDTGQTSRGQTRPAALLFAQANPSLADQIPNYPDPAQIWGTSPSHSFKAVLNTGYDITDSSQLYLFFNYARTKTDESFNYRPSQSFTGVPDTTGTLHNLNRNGSFNTIYLTPCPTGNPTCPSGGFVQDANTFSFLSLYPAGFTPRFVGVTQQVYGVAGYKGETAGNFSYDLSGSLSENTLDLSMFNSLSASYGPASQTSFQFGKTYQRELDVNGDFSLPVEVGLAAPLTVSFGGEYRRETYELTPGDVQSYGAGPFASQPLYTQLAPGTYIPVLNASGAQVVASQSPAASGYGGTSPQSAGTWSQRSYGFYGDLETDIVKALSVGVAGRYEHYSNFGDATVGKVNAIYHLSDAIAVRGGVGTGFHAPSPGQSHDSILTTNFIAGNQVQTGTYPVDNPIAIYYGAAPLKPGEGDQLDRRRSVHADGRRHADGGLLQHQGAQSHLHLAALQRHGNGHRGAARAGLGGGRRQCQLLHQRSRHADARRGRGGHLPYRSRLGRAQPDARLQLQQEHGVQVRSQRHQLRPDRRCRAARAQSSRLVHSQLHDRRVQHQRARELLRLVDRCGGLRRRADLRVQVHHRPGRELHPARALYTERRGDQSVQHLPRQDRRLLNQPDLPADQQHRRRPGLSASGRPVRAQRRILVCAPARRLLIARSVT